MRRPKRGCTHAFLRKLSRQGQFTCIVVLTFISTNCAIFVFSAFTITKQHEATKDLVRRDFQGQGKRWSTILDFEDNIENVTGQRLEDTITIKNLLKILQNVKGINNDFRQSYIQSVLLHNNITLDIRRRSLCPDCRASKRTSPNDLLSIPYAISTNLARTSKTHPSQPKSNAQSTIQFKVKIANSRLPEQKEIPSVLSLSVKRPKNGDALSSLKPTLDFPIRNSGISDLRRPRNGIAPNESSYLISCIENTKTLIGKLKPTMVEKLTDDIISMFPMIQSGGRYTPRECMPKEKTAVIIPYRNRYSHLHILLLNILPLLIKQNVQFTIFVVEQLHGVFNRGMLVNIGFLEALKMDNFDCFIFHDVDLIPINVMNVYHCNHQPTHFVTGVNKFKYKLMYKNMFGGVVAFSKNQFQNINGASNLYFGWGGEDDDLLKRILRKGYKVIRKHADIGLYDMIKHKRDESNAINPFRGQMLKFTEDRQDTEGLNTTVYTIRSVERLPLYTWMKVNINITAVLMRVFDYAAVTTFVNPVFNCVTS